MSRSSDGSGVDHVAFQVRPQRAAPPRFVPQKSTILNTNRQWQASKTRFQNQEMVPRPAKKIKLSTGQTVPKPVQFREHKTAKSFTEPKTKVPTKKMRPATKYPHPRAGSETALTVRKPVATFIPIDAWALIFRTCDLKFLLRARFICKDWHKLLEQQALWRAARVNQFGEFMPDCPAGISEVHYATLLVGRGCQIKPCTRRETRKIYWPFMIRMCEACAKTETITPTCDNTEAKVYAQMYAELDQEVKTTLPANLAGLLPAGFIWAGRFTEGRSLDDDESIWANNAAGAYNYRIMAREYQALQTEFANKVMTDASYFLFWTRLKWNAARERMIAAKNLDGWLEVEAPNKTEELREKKREYFFGRAQDLEPPMSREILERMAAFQGVLDTQNGPTNRSWDLLRAKIDHAGLRAQAERLVLWEAMNTPSVDEDDGDDDEADDCKDDSEYIYDRVSEHRATSWLKPAEFKPEQQVVVNIAKRELDELIDIVHDEDVLLMLLDRVRKSYEALDHKPRGLNGDGREGEYWLTLDDARLVIKDVLMPKLGEKSTVRGKKVTGSLRCIACTRQDCKRVYNFEQLICHIRNEHAIYVGHDMHYYKLAVPRLSRYISPRDNVAWYQIPWPKSIPALPCHRRAQTTMIWDPDQETEYIQHGGNADAVLFDNVEPSSEPPISADDFASNFCRAVQTMSVTHLDRLPIFKIALEYAARRRAKLFRIVPEVNRTSIRELENLEASVQRSDCRIVFKFTCGLCAKDQDASYRKRVTNLSAKLEDLAKHWRTKHRIGLDVITQDLIHLPSDAEMIELMDATDRKLETEKKILSGKGRKYEDEYGNVGTDPRSAALLSVPTVASQFDLLFVRVGRIKTRAHTEETELTNDGMGFEECLGPI